jgi:hypothetical protein
MDTNATSKAIDINGTYNLTIQTKIYLNSNGLLNNSFNLTGLNSELRGTGAIGIGGFTNRTLIINLRYSVDNVPTNDWQILHDIDSNNVGFQLRYVNTGGTKSLNYEIARLGTADNCPTSYNIDLGRTWTQIGMMFKNNKINLYINGTNVQNSSDCGSGTGGNGGFQGFRLNDINDGSSPQGEYDEAIYYNRILSQAEIITIYNDYYSTDTTDLITINSPSNNAKLNGQNFLIDITTSNNATCVWGLNATYSFNQGTLFSTTGVTIQRFYINASEQGLTTYTYRCNFSGTGNIINSTHVLNLTKNYANIFSFVGDSITEGVGVNNVTSQFSYIVTNNLTATSLYSGITKGQYGTGGRCMNNENDCSIYTPIQPIRDSVFDNNRMIY